MSGPPQENWNVGHGDLQSLATNQAETGRDHVSDEPPSPNRQVASIKYPSHSGSSLPYPFDSQPSLNNGNGSHARKTTLVRRIIEKFHVLESHLPGYIKGEVDQIIPSLNDYCSGYGKVAAIENLDSEFLIYRKFGWLRNYALLHLQDELVALQHELAEFDKWEFRDGDQRRLLSRRLDYERPDSIRKEIVAKVHSKLKEYDEALLRTQKIQAIKRPSLRSQRNVHNLIHNTQSLVSSEAGWIREGTDLAALGPDADHGWLNTLLANTLNAISRTAVKRAFSNILGQTLFRTHEQKIKTGDEALHLVSLDRLDNILRAVITMVAAILLLVPVFVLFKLRPTNNSEVERKINHQILTIFIFTLLFSVSCSIFTQAKKQKVFTATAAYCAVLVVFLGNTSNVLVATNN
ncbi:MAG: hypothetical protein Q9161_001546 [Pseudevernia consocians]